MRAVALLLTATLLVHPAAQLTAQDAEPAPRDDPAPVAYGPLDDPVARANAPPPVAIPDPLDRAARLAVDMHPQVRAAQAQQAQAQAHQAKAAGTTLDTGRVWPVKRNVSIDLVRDEILIRVAVQSLD